MDINREIIITHVFGPEVVPFTNKDGKLTSALKIKVLLNHYNEDVVAYLNADLESFKQIQQILNQRFK